MWKWSIEFKVARSETGSIKGRGKVMSTTLYVGALFVLLTCVICVCSNQSQEAGEEAGGGDRGTRR